MQERRVPLRRRTASLRLLAAALAGALGAFGVQAGAHTTQQSAGGAAKVPAVKGDARTAD